MDEAALLIGQGKAGGGIAGLQGRLLDARLGEVRERLVDEGKGVRRPVPRTGGFERIERGIERAARKRRWSRGHQILLVDRTRTRWPIVLTLGRPAGACGGDQERFDEWLECFGHRLPPRFP
jgi:hypothetical protein